MQSYLEIVCAPGDLALIAQLADDQKHAAALTSLAARSLTRGQTALALIMADRRCRIAPLPEPIDLVLRAELLHRVGYSALALRDVEAALLLEPDDRLANLKLLSWGSPEQQQMAAACLIAFELEPGPVLAVLQRLGATAAGQAHRKESLIEGWVAWRGSSALAFNVADRDQPHLVKVNADPTHPLATGLGAAASFVIEAGQASVDHWSGIARDEGTLSLVRTFNPDAPEPMPTPTLVVQHQSSPANPAVTVIIPVYGDLAATRTCIDCLLSALENEQLAIRVLVVNDASPDPDMAAYLAALPVDLISNPQNLGFVGAVNAALDACPTGDVILLNADTIVPTRIVGRLAEIARANPGVGTITPLSNNGELTSLPVAFRENPMPTDVELERIDRIAQCVNAGVLLDLPSGIGFCLYVTRRCLDAVGGLSSLYERGYGEDVHLCLAAREAGLRNVCALSIFVGHLGTRSFGATKRRLVMRNTKQVAARFPGHEAEVAAFVAADPLTPVRHAIGRRLIEGFTGRLIIAAPGSANAARQRRAERAPADLKSLLILHTGADTIIQAFASDGALEAETAFDWPTDAKAWHRFRQSLQPDDIEVYDPVAFAALGFDPRAPEIDLIVVDAAALANRTGGIAASAMSAWSEIATHARRIIVPDAPANAFTAATWPEYAAKIIPFVSGKPAPHAPAVAGHHPRLGVVLLNETANCRALLRTLAATLDRSSARGPDGAPALVVLGSTVDDLALMRPGGMLISGTCEPHEIAMLCAIYKLTHLIAVSSGAHFGSIAEAAATATGRPMARFDWSPTGARVPSPDLWITPQTDDPLVCRAVAEWMFK